MKRRFIVIVLLCAGLLTLVLSAIFVPFMNNSVDNGLTGSAKSALAAAGVTGVTASTDWATVTLTGPPSARARALAAASTMAHAGAVDHIVYRTTDLGTGTGGAGASPSPSGAGSASGPASGSPSPSASASASPSPSAAATPATVIATIAGAPPKVTLAGTVATAAQHQAILSAAVAGYGAANVADHIAVRGGAPTAADAAAVPQFGKLLTAFGPNVAAGTVSLASGAIRVTATGLSDAGAASATTAVSAASAAGVSVSGRISAPTATSPAPAAVQAQIRAALGHQGITFAFGSATLTAASDAILTQVAAILTKAPDTSTVIAGYTDNQGTAAGNLTLSQARAQAVRAFLAAHGIAASRMKAVGYGESHPIASNATAAGRLANRRVDFTVSGS